MVELETLEQFAEILRQLRPGEAAEMTDDVLSSSFRQGSRTTAPRGGHSPSHGRTGA